MDKSNPKVSVIICAYTMERLKDIHEAVGSVLAQTLKPYEVIIAVDHNKQLYHTLAETYRDSVELHPNPANLNQSPVPSPQSPTPNPQSPIPLLPVLNEGAQGLSETRNVGIGAASGDIVAFIDDDAIAEPDWLENLIRPFQSPIPNPQSPVVAVGGRAIPLWSNGRRPLWFPEELDWIIGCTYKGLPIVRKFKVQSSKLNSSSFSNLEPRTSNLELRTSNLEPRTSNLELRTSNLEPRTSNLEPRTLNLEPRTLNLEPRTSNLEPRTLNLEPRTLNLEPRTSNLEPRTLNLEPRTSNLEPRTSNLEPRTSNLELRTIRNVPGCNMAFRKEAFERVGFFRSDIGGLRETPRGGEEADLCLRISRALPEALIVHQEHAAIHHKVTGQRTTWRYLWQRSYNEGFYKAKVQRLHQQTLGARDRGLETGGWEHRTLNLERRTLNVEHRILSTEGSYLRYLLFKSIPGRLARFYRRESLPQIAAIIMCIAATGVGYLVGRVRG